MSRFINENTKKNSQKAFLNEKFIHIHQIHNGGRLGEASVRDRENEAGEDRKFAKQNKSLQENM